MASVPSATRVISHDLTSDDGPNMVAEIYNPWSVTGPRSVRIAAAAALFLLPPVMAAQSRAVDQQSADEYTRYELLTPGSGKFRILYFVTATTPGSRYFFNPIRKGSVASDESVTDPVTGAPLRFEVVAGSAARTQGFAAADLETDYIRVELPRPVPDNGEVRIVIEKTYADPKSYYQEGTEVVFARSLGIKRNAVVLPPGYELVRCNVPSQVLTEPDRRVLISFINPGADPVSLVLRGRRLP